mgnify:CR=1
MALDICQEVKQQKRFMIQQFDNQTLTKAKKYSIIKHNDC